MSKGAVVVKAAKSPLIFSIVAIFGVVGTAYCAVKDYKKHEKMLDSLIKKRTEEKEAELKEKGEKNPVVEEADIFPEKKFDKFLDITKACWTAWIPTVAVGASTIASIILAHKVSAGQIAAISAAAAFGGKKLSEQKYAVKRFIGAENYQKLENFFTGEKIDKSNLDTPDDGMYWYHDQYSNKNICMRPEDAQKAINETEEEMAKNGFVSFATYADKLKLDIKGLGLETVGWSSSKMVDSQGYSWIGIKAEERISDAGRRYYSIVYPHDPTTDFVDVSKVIDEAETDVEKLLIEPKS